MRFRQAHHHRGAAGLVFDADPLSCWSAGRRMQTSSRYSAGRQCARWADASLSISKAISSRSRRSKRRPMRLVQFSRDMGDMYLRLGTGRMIESVVCTTKKAECGLKATTEKGEAIERWWVGLHVVDPEAWRLRWHQTTTMAARLSDLIQKAGQISNNRILFIGYNRQK